MAKRRIGEPKVPAGPEYDFFVLMQRHVLYQGDKALTALAQGSGWSRQTWHKALRGPVLPNRDLVQGIIKHLYPDEGKRAQAEVEALTAWTRAVEFRTNRVRGSSSDDRGTFDHLPQKVSRGVERRGGSTSIGGFQQEVLSYMIRDSYERAGRPSLRTIEQRMPEEKRIGRTTLHDWLRGRRVPSYAPDRIREVLSAIEGRSLSEQDVTEAMTRMIDTLGKRPGDPEADRPEI
ncbi:hypothetical protein [Streptomyces sp. bgisy095]|uniref:hypothetical protein n=1 Tax=unclassified Streptomyces TaxID=2593676 RepID=UPI003D744219